MYFIYFLKLDKSVIKKGNYLLIFFLNKITHTTEWIIINKLIYKIINMYNLKFIFSTGYSLFMYLITCNFMFR